MCYIGNGARILPKLDDIKPLTGSVESLAKAIERYSKVGTEHLIIQPTPCTLQAIDRLREIVYLYRNDKKNNQ